MNSTVEPLTDEQREAAKSLVAITETYRGIGVLNVVEMVAYLAVIVTAGPVARSVAVAAGVCATVAGLVARARRSDQVRALEAAKPKKAGARAGAYLLNAVTLVAIAVAPAIFARFSAGIQLAMTTLNVLTLILARFAAARLNET